jgi:hypothetical protein
MSNKLTLVLSSVRNTEYLKTAVDQINENLYRSDLFKEDRVVMETHYNLKGEVGCHVITGSEIDFFQIGLRYGALEEKRQAKQISDILNRY